MRFNYATEKLKFDREQEKLAEQYREAGMSEVAIRKMYEFDYEQFKKQRVFCKHNQYLETKDTEKAFKENDRHGLLFKFLYEFSTEMSFTNDDRFSWIEDIDNEKLYEVLHNMNENDLDLLTMLVIEGYGVVEVARLKDVSHQAISKRWKKIQKNLVVVVAD